MIAYLKYKFIIFHREILHFGIPYILIYPILILGLLFFQRQLKAYDYGEIIASVLFVSTMYLLTPKKKERDWLFFYRKRYSCLFLINILIALPFLILFFFLDYYYAIVFALIFTLLISFFYFDFSFSILEKINLSFLMKDFELIEGFRKYWYIHLITIGISIIGFSVGNYNLATAGYAFFIITIGFYYQKVEPIYWIWISKCKSTEFIHLKIRSVFKKTLFLSVIFFISNVFFTKNLDFLFVVFASCLGVINCMLSKYAYLNNLFSIQISLGISIGILIMGFFNPLLSVIALIYFYFLKRKAIYNITQIMTS
ncbi:MAG: hypothetical protein ABJN84_08540 [Flavobacteriaceae bacterium]